MLVRYCFTYPLLQCLHSPSLTTTPLPQVRSPDFVVAFEEVEQGDCNGSYYCFSSFTSSPSGLSRSLPS